MNFKKLPAEGRACGWIRNRPEPAHLRFHCRPRNRGKGALQPLILTPPEKIVDNCLPLRFRQQFFLRTRPWHHQQTEQQKICHSEQDVNKVFYIPQGHPLQSTSMGLRKLGLEKVSPCFSRSLPAQRDKEDIEDKYEWGDRTTHHKHFNTREILQNPND